MDEQTYAELTAHGVPAKIARDLGLTPQAVSIWMCKKRIPAERVVEVEMVTGIDRERLRPDLYRVPAA